MGWSCTATAGQTMDRWIAACLAQTGSQNCFRVGEVGYFWETSSTEHYDGAITGTIWKDVPGPDPEKKYCKRAGTFRINPDGSVARAPAFLKRV
jgi:hypothetical protein